MCRAELLTWQWDSEVLKRFQTVVGYEIFSALSIRGRRLLTSGTMMCDQPELLEIGCQQVWER